MERPLLFFTALFILDFSKWILRGLLDESMGIPSWGEVGRNVFAGLSDTALVVLMAVVVVRHVGSASAAIGVLAVLYPVAQCPLDWLVQGGGPLEPPFVASTLAANAVWVLVMFGLLELIYRRTSRLWVSPLLASSLATIAALVLRLLVFGPLLDLPTGDLAAFTAAGMAGAAVFALVLTVGYRLAGWADVALDERPRTRVSRSGYATTLYCLLGIPLLVSLVVIGLDIRAPPGESGWLLAVTLTISLVLASACFFRFVYLMWSALPPDQARMTPGRAIGLLLVPLFNVYWAFQVFAGFAQGFNAVRARRNLNTAPALPVALFAAYPALALLTLAPIVGVWLTPLSWALSLTIVVRASDAANTLI